MTTDTKPIGTVAHQLLVYTVKDNSLSPALKRGDLVSIEPVSCTQELTQYSGSVFLFATGSGHVLRRVQATAELNGVVGRVTAIVARRIA